MNRSVVNQIVTRLIQAEISDLIEDRDYYASLRSEVTSTLIYGLILSEMGYD